MTLLITQEIHVEASLDQTFEALLEQLGPGNESPQGKMPMKIEAWPGGRWYRDLGDGNGHLWGHVQAIKRPTLFEITGPLFMSYGVVIKCSTGSARKGWDADQVSSQGVWGHPGRAPAGRRRGMGQYELAHQGSGRTGEMSGASCRGGERRADR